MKSVIPLDLAGTGLLEPLGGTAMRLEFRHKWTS
jgi:hypothetical protein